jgi:cyclophilin family peptidyl-prolyl cis-trans isomerase
LWIDQSSERISHSTKGLLTHKTLDVTPSFGITTRKEQSLDSTHTVFGQVLWEESTLSLFQDFQDIPTYALERPSGYDEFNTGGMTTSIYNTQKDFFRGAAKTFGDTRVSKLYEGKLLRRVEVLRVGKL